MLTKQYISSECIVLVINFMIYMTRQTNLMSTKIYFLFCEGQKHLLLNFYFLHKSKSYFESKSNDDLNINIQYSMKNTSGYS